MNSMQDTFTCIFIGERTQVLMGMGDKLMVQVTSVKELAWAHIFAELELHIRLDLSQERS